MIRRFAIVLLLLISFLVLGRETVKVWRQKTAPPPPPAKATKLPPLARTSKIEFNPAIAGNLVDLRKGYLFNEQRNLLPDKKDTKEDTAANGDLDDVTYCGSIISNDLTRGMVSYPKPEEKKEAARDIRRRRKRPPAKVEKIYEMLSKGDTFRGLEVIEITPEKIVFGKGDQKTEKFLYDQNKVRLEPPPGPKTESQTKIDNSPAAIRKRQLEIEEREMK